MRRWVVPITVAVAAALLVACGDDTPGSDGGAGTTEGATGGTGATDGTGSTGGDGGPTASTPDLDPPTTLDHDGREPDEVEPPPVGGVPGTAVPTLSERRVALPGFGEVLVQVRTVDGEVVEWCLLLAETPAQTQRGLMEVTDPELGGYDGMLFRFTDEHDGGFYMRNTPQPLMIAYLAADGSVVDIRRMEPCEDVDGCPTYPPDGGAYLRTVEVPVGAGGVEDLGIVEGAGVEVVDTGETCPA